MLSHYVCFTVPFFFLYSSLYCKACARKFNICQSTWFAAFFVHLTTLHLSSQSKYWKPRWKSYLFRHRDSNQGSSAYWTGALPPELFPSSTRICDGHPRMCLLLINPTCNHTGNLCHSGGRWPVVFVGRTTVMSRVMQAQKLVFFSF